MTNLPYVYALSYKGVISYIGIHNGNDKYYFSGGVIPKKMGKDKFIKGILEYCDIEELCIREMYYIKLYNPKFNLTTGGELTSFGTKHSESTILKRKQSFNKNINHINYISKLCKIRNKINNPCIKFSIKCLNDNLEFTSIRRAAEFYKIDNSHLSKHIRGEFTYVKSLKFIKLT